MKKIQNLSQRKSSFLFTAIVWSGIVFALAAHAEECPLQAVCIDEKTPGLQGQNCEIFPLGVSCYIGCEAGKCIDDNTPVVCTDTDEGKNYFVRGTTQSKGAGPLQ